MTKVNMFSRHSLRRILAKHKEKILQNNEIKFKNEINYLKSKYNAQNKENFIPDEATASLSDDNDDVDDDTMEMGTTIMGTPPPAYDISLPPKIEPKKQYDYEHLDIFHRAVSPIMVLAQCFALMPIANVWNANPRQMNFGFRTFPMIVFSLFFIASTTLTLTMLKHLLKLGVDAKNFVGLVFFLSVQSTCLLFFALARQWPRLIRFWTKIELLFTQEPYETPKRNLAKRVQFAAIIIIVLSLGEHALYLTSAVLSYKRQREICAAAFTNVTYDISFEDYIKKTYVYVFEILPYNKFIAVYILLTNGICTFIWNYADLFIMMVSKGLTYRYEQISVRIKKLENKEVSESTFMEIRQHYVKVCELLDRVDEHLSGIILLSSANNLYFVCYQLLNIFNKLRWPINYIYFWYSMLYLIGRTAFVFLTAADINDQSKSAIGILRRVSAKTWCIEIERLIFQMSSEIVALSGKKFFFLTRRLLFGMAGTIVTYELVLLQFDEPNRRKGLGPLCA